MPFAGTFFDPDYPCFPHREDAPFAAQLNELFFSPRESDNLDFPIHGPNVIRFVLGVLDPKTITRQTLHNMPGLSPRDSAQLGIVNNKLFHHLPSILQCLGVARNQPLPDRTKAFLAICALYHDLGKVIRRANHPQIGANLLRNYQLNETRKLVHGLALNNGEGEEARHNRFSRLVSVVQHHDKFGVVSTGEGGLPIFSDIPYFRSSQGHLEGILQNVTSVMLVNLADAAAVNTADKATQRSSLKEAKSVFHATPQNVGLIHAHLDNLMDMCTTPENSRGLDERLVNDLLDDWSLLCDVLRQPDVHGDRGLLKRHLLELERNPARAIERILRILRVAAGSCGAQTLAASFSSTLVESVLVGALGSYQLQAFCDQLAAVVKFDYGLGFFRALICGCVRKVLATDPEHHQVKRLTPGEQAALAAAPAEHDNIAQLATERVIQVIKGLLGRYAGVLGPSADQSRRFGIQMNGLSQEERILSTIIDFLCFQNKEFIAVTWIADEVSIWSLD